MRGRFRGIYSHSTILVSIACYSAPIAVVCCSQHHRPATNPCPATTSPPQPDSKPSPTESSRSSSPSWCSSLRSPTWTASPDSTPLSPHSLSTPSLSPLRESIGSTTTTSSTAPKKPTNSSSTPTSSSSSGSRSCPSSPRMSSKKKLDSFSVFLYIASMIFTGFSFLLLRLSITRRLRIANKLEAEDTSVQHKHLYSLFTYLVAIAAAFYHRTWPSACAPSSPSSGSHRPSASNRANPARPTKTPISTASSLGYKAGS